jgi:hypothetical protein
MSWSNSERKAYLEAVLNDQGIAVWGRASEIKRRVGCSNASAASWLEGHLPKNIELALQLCDEFNVDFYKWATGESRGSNITEQKLTELLLACKMFEDQYGVDLDAKQLAALVLMGFEDKNSMSLFLRNLKNFLGAKDGKDQSEQPEDD